MNRMDYYDILPSGLEAYLSHYGWHFNKKLYEWAISRMRDKNGKKVEMYKPEEVESILKSNGIEIVNDYGYDKNYAMHMGLSDHYNGSIPDDKHLALYVKEILDDKDGYDGIVLTRFLADCNAKGIPIMWEDMI